MLRYCLIATLTILTFTAKAETVMCTEVVPPTTITQPGMYCLFKDYALNLEDGAAININANNVVLDMNGHRITNGAAGQQSTASGIQLYTSNIGAPVKSFTVRNGTLRGFSTGISLISSGTAGHLVEDMVIDKSLSQGISTYGNSVIIRRNRVTGTGTTSERGHVAGISVDGRNVTIADNEVTDTNSGGAAFGISTSRSLSSYGGAILTGNRINELHAGEGYDEIAINVTGNALVSNNQILDSDDPAGGTTYGIRAGSTTVKIVNNAVNVIGTAYSGGTQVGSTNN